MADSPTIDDGATVDAMTPAPTSESTPVEVGYCLCCGYDMRGLGTEVCPECGTRFDLDEARAHNYLWCNDLVTRMRISHLVVAATSVNAVLFLLTGGASIPMGAFVGVVGLVLMIIHLLIWVPMFRMRSQLRDERGLPRRCGSLIVVAATVMLGVPVAAFCGWVGVVVALAAGLLLTAVQAKSYVEGKRRGWLFGVPVAVEESVSFALGVSKFFGTVAVILLMAVLAVR